MLEQLKKYRNKSSIAIVPRHDLKLSESINNILKNVIYIDYVEENYDIVINVNNSKIRKIYLFAYNDIYRFILPRINKKIEICWVYNESFSNLSSGGVRYYLNTIFEFYERNLVNYIGCINKDNLSVFENAGYKCEYIDLKIKKVNNKSVNSNSIGILSDDYDPNNNFYNQLAALTFVDYGVCKFRETMSATKHFCEYFNIKSLVTDNMDIVVKDNFVNLYVNFTNTNKDLIMRSYNYGVPVIVGNTDFYDRNEYLKEHLVVKSDDDINEIVDKIKFVKKNYKKIMEEYNNI